MGLNYPALIKIMGVLTVIESIAMLPCIVTAVVYNETSVSHIMVVLSSFLILTGMVIMLHLKFSRIYMRVQEGFLVTCMAWIYCSIIGLLPFYLSGYGYSFIDCLMESISAFTTTGCSILDSEAMPKSLILWRGICNWLGGMGILVLVLSVFPLLGISGHTMAKAEAPGATFDRMGSKATDTGKFLYFIYIFLSATEFLLLALGPLDTFDALINTMTTISTTGTIVTKANAAAHASEYTRAVILIFTFLSSVNYFLYFMIMTGHGKDALKNVELRWYIKIILSGTILIALCLRFTDTYDSLWQALKDSLCQTVAISATSGFYVCDYTKWPSFTHAVIMGLMIVGSCSGSTGGSLKVMRVVTMLKMCKRGIFLKNHPNAIKPISYNGKNLTAPIASAVTVHILLYFGVIFAGSLLLSFNNLDMETTITTVLGAFSNTGSAFGLAGPSGDYTIFNGFSKLVISVLMVTGRLEMYAVVLLLSGSFWKPDRVKKI